MITRADVDSRNPLRPPDWRWRRAQQLAFRGRRRRPQPWDDELVAAALKYIRRSVRGKSQRQADRLREQMPAIAAACQLQLACDATAWRIEAGVLAGLDAEQIAGRVGMTADVIHIYEQLFFDVCEKLDARCYVQLQAIGRCPVEGHDGRNTLGWLLRTLAYHGGPEVLELVERTFIDNTPFGSSKHSAGCEPWRAEEPDIQAAPLAALLTLPEDTPARRTLALMGDLMKSTQMGGAAVDSPLMEMIDHLVTQFGAEMPPEGALCERRERQWGGRQRLRRAERRRSPGNRVGWEAVEAVRQPHGELDA